MQSALISGAAAAALMLSAAASAREPSQGAAAPAASTPEKAKKVCRRIVPTGSIMAKKFCLTADEWKEFEARNADDVDTMFSRRTAGMCDYDCTP